VLTRRILHGWAGEDGCRFLMMRDCFR